MMKNTKYLENINDFAKVGLLYYENSGENLLRLYLERIYRIKTGCNIKKEKNKVFKQSENIEINWIVASDYPCRNKAEYSEIAISSAILLVRNPVDLIMSQILRDSYFLEEALNKIDQMIEEWKEFYKYWINAPIPIHIVRYEDLIHEPREIIKQLSKFLLGIKALDNSKLEYMIKHALIEKIDKHYFAYDVEVSQDHQNILSGQNIEKIKEKFYSKLDKILKKFNYEVNADGQALNWMAEFNKDNLVKSVDFHEYLTNQYLTASYFTLKLG
jgi:hypothetical protein